LAFGMAYLTLEAGDFVMAERYSEALLTDARQLDSRIYRAYYEALTGVIVAKRGDPAQGMALLRSALDIFRVTSQLPHLIFLPRFAAVAAAAGQRADALAAIDEASQQVERNQALWYAAEILRIKGEVMLATGAEQESAARNCIERALELAHRQGALSLELRAALSLAQLQRDRGGAVSARQRLAAIYARFTEGFDTADLRAAKALLTQQ
jgi:ATP/maltotriose-dependent transcriptional regulator MalT